jgi:hypothetical protein
MFPPGFRKGRSQSGESWISHAHDREDDTVQPNGFADRARGAAERVFPIPIIDYADAPKRPGRNTNLLSIACRPGLEPNRLQFSCCPNLMFRCFGNGPFVSGRSSDSRATIPRGHWPRGGHSFAQVRAPQLVLATMTAIASAEAMPLSGHQKRESEAGIAELVPVAAFATLGTRNKVSHQ